MKEKKAYTLAEVLITLGIIGIVAALIIPGFMGKYRQKVNETKAKKLTSDTNKVLRNIISENGDCTSITCTNFDAAMFSVRGLTQCDNGVCNADLTGQMEILNNIMKKYYNANIDEGMDYLFGSLVNEDWSDLDNVYNKLADLSELMILGSYKLPNGVYILLGYVPQTDKKLPVITIDTNGYAPPNKYGEDMFAYGYTDSGDIVDLSNMKYMQLLTKHSIIEVSDEEEMSRIIENKFPDMVKSGKIFFESLIK